MTTVNVKSEIDNLKRIMLHRPGRELQNLVPEYLEEMLFDDIPYLDVAQTEHDFFAHTLRECGVEVVYITDLVKQSIVNDDVKCMLIDEYIAEAGNYNTLESSVLKDYLLGQSTNRLVNMLIGGIRKNELSLSDYPLVKEYIDRDYPYIAPPIPNMYFSRDAFAFVGNGVIINKMSTHQRARETLFAKYIFSYNPEYKDIPQFYDRNAQYSIEGGDVLVLSDNVLAIGISQRTQYEAILLLAHKLLRNSNFKTILAIDIPKGRASMHLDTVFTMVGHNVFTIHDSGKQEFTTQLITMGANNNLHTQQIVGQLDVILGDVLNLDNVTLIKCGGNDPVDASREQWSDGANTLAVAPNEVIVYSRNTVTNELLNQHGIKTHKIPCSELSRGRGGPRCMSMPIIRIK
ncbi:MAG: arginine deiminase [Clostridia bacterium]|nr:arginine deiminase [Clostridia bacterium]